MECVTIHWKAAKQYFVVVLFVLQIFHLFCDFGFINLIIFGLGTVRIEKCYY